MMRCYFGLKDTTLLFYRREYLEKEENDLIKISKNEAFRMRSLGYDEFVKKTYSKHPSYFLVEEKENIYRREKGTNKRRLVRLSAMNMLEKIRRESILEKHI